VNRLRAFVLLTIVAAPTVLAQAPDRSKPPEPGPPPALQLPQTARLKLSNGIPVLFVERHKVPLVDVLVVLRGGASSDPAGRPGLASLTASLLDRGAGSRSALEISDVADFLGADLSADADWDATTIGVNVPVARLSDALALLSDLVRNPTFPAEEVERVRDELLTEMLQWRDEPGELAATAMPQALYGSHPYGRRTEGDTAFVRSVTRDEIRLFHTSHYQPYAAALVAVGDVSSATLMPMLEKAFGSWSATRAGTGGAPVPPPPAPQVRDRRVVLVDKPGAPQTQIFIARVGPSRGKADYFPILVANTILGGSFTSRLNHNLRETKGYTYGAFSAFDWRLSTGPFVASAAVQTDKTGPALVEFFKELEAIRGEVPADELRRAKNYTALRFPAGFEAVGQVAGRIHEQYVYGLPDDFFNTYVSKIEAVTAADVKRVAVETIDPKACVVVLVGDRSKIEKEVRALSLGPITFRSIDDVLGKTPGAGKSKKG
jgi:zinc protease